MRRRDVLRGLGTLAIPLPVFEAQAAAPPRRFLVFNTPNGTHPERWWPVLSGKAAPTVRGTAKGVYVSAFEAADASAFTLAPITAPLETHQKDLLFIEGLDHCSGATRNKGNFDGHPNVTGLLSGHLVEQDGTADCGPGITVDQVMAERLGSATRFPSLHLGVKAYDRGYPGYASVSWFGARRPNPPENDPAKVFARVFGELQGDARALEALRAQRRSILDATLEQMATLNMRLGAGDRAKLNNHAESLRDVERRLGLGLGPASIAPACRPTAPGGFDATKDADIPATTRAQIDLLVLALSCDLTRVATLQNGYEFGHTVFSWLAVSGEHHGITHCGDDDVAAYDKIATINTWYARQLAYLIDRLKAVPEGEGTLFDSTLTLWLHGVTKGANHSNDNLPVLLVGHLQRQLRTGRYLRLARAASRPGVRLERSRSLAELHATLLRLMGVPVDSFGDPAFFRAALPLA